MNSLRILASGQSKPARANARGKLFEKIMAEVLRRQGYDIDKQSSNVSHSGMEIDIEGRSRITNNPLYAECKCYSTDVTSEKLQNFFAKYMTRWLSNSRSDGLFVALPGINSYARGFYDDHCASEGRISIGLMQQPDVIDALIEGGIVASPDVLEARLDLLGVGSPGDRTLLCTDQGNYWMQYVIPAGSGIATMIQFFDSLGNPITDSETVEYIQGLLPESSTFEVLLPQNGEGSQPGPSTADAIDTVVEVQGSSSCFEYQFPASPQFFVGRSKLLEEVELFAEMVARRETSCRGLLFEANSGWGKSSLVLATVERLRALGHFAVALDSRSASTPLFVLKAVKYVLDLFGDFDGLVPEPPVLGGVDAAAAALTQIGEQLKESGRGLFVFFDQFENTFYLLDVLKRVAQLCLKVGDAQENVVLGFSWKTDLVGLTREFPFRWRDMIIESCQTIRLPQFSVEETDALLDRLADELNMRVRKDLRFLLSEFSQGYPWLLKKLCAHVKNQRQAGVPQAEIARGLLNVEQLFLDDLQGLNAQEEEALRWIARIAPVSVADIGEEFEPELVQSLVSRRLVVKVGMKYDVYWDIFRDYLNTGRLPIEEIYLIRSPVGTILTAAKILNDAAGPIETPTFKQRAQFSDGAFLNVARDLRLLQLADASGDSIKLLLPVGTSAETLLRNIREHVQERLTKNRCVHRVLRDLQESTELSVSDLASVLQEEFPYISAVQKTWETYAKFLANWLDFSDLAILDKSTNRLARYEAGTQVRERDLLFARRRAGMIVPSIHFDPVVQVANRLVSAIQNGESVDWSGITRSTIYKSLSMLEQMGLIERRAQTILVRTVCHAFALNREERLRIAQSAARAWPAFKSFLRILMASNYTLKSQKQLATELVEELGVPWRPSTATTNVKIMLDWARYLELAPGVYAHSQRGRFRREPQGASLPLFEQADGQTAE